MTHGSYFHVSWRDIEGNANLTLRLGRAKLRHIPLSWDLNKSLHYRQRSYKQITDLSSAPSRSCCQKILTSISFNHVVIHDLGDYSNHKLFVNIPVLCINYWGVNDLGSSSTQGTDPSWSTQWFNCCNALTVAIRSWYKSTRLNIKRVSPFPFQRKIMKLRRNTIIKRFLRCLR